jgi:HK97 family phage prohead protease
LPIDAAQLFNRPWFLTREALAQLVVTWQQQSDSVVIDDYRPSPARRLADRARAAGLRLQNPSDDDDDENDEDKPYPIDQSGIALIPVSGVLTRGGSWWGTSYTEVREMCADAIEDPAVRAMCFVFDSPGGQAASEMLETANYLYAARGAKPMLSVSDDQCFSAAYCLAAATGPIACNILAGVGSIGAWTAHIDTSKALSKAGIEVAYIYSGARKIDANPHQPLSDPAREALQTEVDRIRNLFAQSVVTSRRHAGLSLSDVFETEAACYFGPAGVTAKLADTVGSVVDGVAMLRGALSPSTTYSLPGSNAARLPAAARQPRLIEASAAIDPTTAELRVIPGARAQVSGTAGSRKVSMLCGPYAGTSMDLGNGVTEKYARGCFDLSGDPRVCWSHDDRLILGRSSAGTARFWDANDGLRCECDLPATTFADDVLELLRSGNVSQSSLAFWILTSHYEGRTRVIDRALVKEASIVSWSAYPATTAAVAPVASVAALRAQIDSRRTPLSLSGWLAKLEEFRKR